MNEQSKRLEKEWLGIAQKAACKAGLFLASVKNRNNIRANFKKDVKILADVQAEKIIIESLRKSSDFDILSEEQGLLRGLKGNGLCWIVDPLDGTLNFLRGVPMACVSIGLWDGDKPILGVVYDFNRREIFSGITSQAAWLNGKKIKVSAVTRKANAVICTGFPAASDFSTQVLGKFVKKIQDYKKVRLLGCAALSLAYVAAGRVDAYMEDSIMRWDIAAGVALVIAAGGAVQMKAGLMDNSFTLKATNFQLVNKSLKG